METTLKIFIKSYIETMLWADGEELTGDSEAHFSLEAMRKIVKDCRNFSASELYDLAVSDCGNSSYRESVSQVAHDFYLTRNRHGAGFWDGDYHKTLGEKLTEFSQSFGESIPYLGDDGKIYL